MDRSIFLYDWKTTYQPEAWHLPAYRKYDYETGEFRDLFINWREFQKAKPAGTNPPMWAIYCDVLRLDADVTLDRTTIIFARRIEVSGDFSLVIDRTGPDEHQLIIYTQEVVHYITAKPAKLNVVAIGTDGNEQTVALQSVETGATGITWMAGKEPVAADATVLPPDKDFLIEGEPLRLLLGTTFQVATLLYTVAAEISLLQLQWIQTIAAANPDTLDLSLQAGAMLNNLVLQRYAGTDALLVPVLDSSVYAASASNLMTLLRQRDQNWTNLRNMKQADVQWQQIVEDAVGDKADQKALTAQLQQQAESSLVQVLQARAMAAKLVVEEKTALDACRIWFEDIGVPRWKEKETINAVFDLVTGAIEVLKEIPAIVAGGPEFAAMPAVAAAKSLLEGVGNFFSGGSDPNPVFGPVTKDEAAAQEIVKKEQAERKKAGENLQAGYMRAGAGAKKVVDAAMNIMKIAAQAAAMEAASRTILRAIGTTVDQSFSTIDLRGLDVVTGGSQDWDILGLEIEQLFEDIKPLETIDGGKAYRLEFRKLIAKGKALCEARLAVAKANSQLAEMKLWSLTAEKSLNRSRARMAQLNEKIRDDDRLQQYAFNKVLDAKRSVYMALESYRRAFMYFTLAERADVPKLPSMPDTVDAFEKTVSTIAGKELTLSGAFKSSPPQTMNKQVALDDPYTIGQLREHGYMTWTLKYNDDHFKNFARVRFTKVNVFVDFEPGYEYEKDISVRILTSGQYSDKNRLRGEKIFVGPATQLNFEYKEIKGLRDISFDGDIDPRYSSDFFNPTPFTTWTFSFNNKDIDMKKIRGLKVLFSGNALSI